MKKALVVSGGGNKGAYGGGEVDYLINVEKKDYDLFVGTSTGSLLCPLIAIGDIEALKNAYTTIKQKDIFKSNPFKFKHINDGFVKTKINYWKVFLNLILRKNKSLGDSSQLRNTIKKIITKDKYQILKESGKRSSYLCC